MTRKHSEKEKPSDAPLSIQEKLKKLGPSTFRRLQSLKIQAFSSLNS